MTNTHETTAYDLAFAGENDLPEVANDAEFTATKRTDRPATAMIRIANPAVSAALEPSHPVDAYLAEEIVLKLQSPVTNLDKLFTLLMDDLDSLPILHSEMLSEIKVQMAQIDTALATLNGSSAEANVNNGQVAATTLADLIFTAVREIRTPVANMQGLLSLVLDDRSALSAPISEMLRLAYEQLEKLARVIDEISETANVFKGQIDVRAQDAALDQILTKAIQRAREEGFEYELVHSNQVLASTLPEIGATAGQCLEALVRHALLEALNHPHEMPIGLFVYENEAEFGEPMLVVEMHDYAPRPETAGNAPQKTLDQQVVCEMTHALSGTYRHAVNETGAMVLSATIPFRALAADQIEPAFETATAASHAYQGVALLAPSRRLSQVLQNATANRLLTQRIGDFNQLIDALHTVYLPTVFIDADLLQNLTGEQLQTLEGAMLQRTSAFVLQHAETDVGGAAALFPVLWDDDLVAITGMLEQPFQPGTQQENLMLITGDNTSEVRPWRKLLSATGNGSMWWPAARPIPAERFPAMIGGVVVVADSTRALPTATWNVLSSLKVRDRKIVVLTGTGTCQLPQARVWDVYRPNLKVCDDTLRRYILFNSPTQRTPRVAVVEDDILMRKLLVSAIEDQAHVTEMGSVQETLTKLRTMAFDVILLDLFLPDGSGLEILKTIHTDDRYIKARSTPIVALTGSSDLELNKTVEEAGACEVLVKPVPMQVLRQKVALLTRENRSRRISGPVQTVTTAAIPPVEVTISTEASKPVIVRSARLPGASKIISLRTLAAAAEKRAKPAPECAIGD